MDKLLKVDIDKIMYSIENIPVGIKLLTKNNNQLLIFPTRENDFNRIGIKFIYVIVCDKNGKPLNSDVVLKDKLEKILIDSQEEIKEWYVV